jgi:hypothetical protein
MLRRLKSSSSPSTGQSKPGSRPNKVVLWVSGNRGVTSEIARSLTQKGTKVTPQFVHQVLYGQRKSTNGVVERALRAAGAPL